MTNPSHTRRYAIGQASFEAQAISPGLHIVATPIGNLADITVRALATLAAASEILCEDTRTTAKLLARYPIRNRLSPYHEHNAKRARPGILKKLKEGSALALVSDAGMPLVSDPGYRLVHEAIDQGIAVTVCPGPSATLTALALSSLPPDRFTFAGFMPQKQGERQRLLAELATQRSTLIFFESPNRIVDTLHDLERTFPFRMLAVSRELTKIHEEVLRGTAGEIAGKLSARAAVKGEITLVIGPARESETVSEAELDEAIAQALETMPASRAAADIAKRFALGKAEVYGRILSKKDAK